ncbi:hypothetical protein BFW41_17025 [Aeromonas hydrophila]|nr:hypothetical protein BFW41_17025 [Aeromonas hydrophila]
MQSATGRMAAGLQQGLQPVCEVESLRPEQHVGQAEILHLIEHVGIVFAQVEDTAAADMHGAAVRDVDGTARLDQYEFMKRMAVLRKGFLRSAWQYVDDFVVVKKIGLLQAKHGRYLHKVIISEYAQEPALVNQIARIS